jgi:hypothetical protein
LALLSPEQRTNFERRFWPKVKKSNEAEGCWIWTGTLSKAGYGQIRLFASKKAIGKKLTIFAHRASYEMFKGSIPDKNELDHLCKKPPCINPDHLESVTHRENDIRGDGLAGTNHRKTHCKHGHPFSSDNLYITPSGTRQCRTCRRTWMRAWIKKHES